MVGDHGTFIRTMRGFGIINPVTWDNERRIHDRLDVGIIIVASCTGSSFDELVVD